LLGLVLAAASLSAMAATLNFDDALQLAEARSRQLPAQRPPPPPRATWPSRPAKGLIRS
jgi:hypothetical protein